MKIKITPDSLDEKKRKKKKKKSGGKKDACYHKVKSRYKVWPSAYASGALVKCRKVGAKNWGTGGKKNEELEVTEEGAGASKSYCEDTPCDEMGFTQKASCKSQGIKDCYKGKKKK